MNDEMCRCGGLVWVALTGLLVHGCATESTPGAPGEDTHRTTVINPASPTSDAALADAATSTSPSDGTFAASSSSGLDSATGEAASDSAGSSPTDAMTGVNLNVPSNGPGASVIPQPGQGAPTAPPEPDSSMQSSTGETGPSDETTTSDTAENVGSDSSAATDPSGTSSFDVTTGPAPCDACAPAPDDCHVSQCNPETGTCELLPKDVASACDDGDPCTLSDQCDGSGTCVGTPRDCSVGDGPCTQGVCVSASGECEAQAVRGGESCDDEDACTQNDKCAEDGRCEGEPVDCSSEGGKCAVGTCDPSNGECESIALTGTACDDENDCTQNDVCDDGSCRGEVPETCSNSAEFSVAEQERTWLLNTRCNDAPLQNDFDVKTILPPGVNPIKGDCTDSSGADVFVALDLTGYSGAVRLFATTDNRETNFDTVLVLLGAAPGSSAAECNYTQLLACNDAIQVSPVKNERSTIEVELTPGRYVLVVDGYLPKDNGRAALSVQVTPL